MLDPKRYVHAHLDGTAVLLTKLSEHKTEHQWLIITSLCKQPTQNSLHTTLWLLSYTLAAPVLLGIMLKLAALPPLQSLAEGPSTVFWVAERQASCCHFTTKWIYLGSRRTWYPNKWNNIHILKQINDHEEKLYLQMRNSLVLVSEDTSGFPDIVGTSLTPQDLIRVPVELKQFKHQLTSSKLKPEQINSIHVQNKQERGHESTWCQRR